MKRILLAAALSMSAAITATAQDRLIKVGTTNLTSDIGLYLAETRGYFAEEGLKVEMIVFDSGAKMVAPLVAGELDVGAGATSAGLFNAMKQGLELRIIADKGTNLEGYSYKTLTVRKALADSGEVKSIADLKGRKVAVVAKGAADESVMSAALASAGLGMADVELSYLPFPQHITAYVNGAIDAAISAEPAVTSMVRNGAAVRLAHVSDFYPVQQTAVLLANGEFIAEREVAIKFTKAYLRGVRDYAATLEGGKIAGPGASEMLDALMSMTGIRDRSLLEEATPVFVHPNGNVVVESVQTDLDYLKAQGLVTADLTAADVVDMSLRDAALAELGEVALPK